MAKEPSLQAVQADEPAVGATLPLSQEAHDELLPVENVPALHKTHWRLPLSAANSPGLQGLQVGLAVASAYVPAMQSVQAVAPASELLPNWHASQKPWPDVAVKRPAGLARVWCGRAGRVELVGADGGGVCGSIILFISG